MKRKYFGVVFKVFKFNCDQYHRLQVVVHQFKVYEKIYIYFSKCDILHLKHVPLFFELI